MPNPVPSLPEICAAARAAGRDRLTEPEGLAVAARLGLAVPHLEVVTGAAAAAEMDLAPFPGDRVVVKVVAAQLGHKSDVGGVAVVEKSPDAVATAVEAMEERLAAAGAGPVEGFSVNEWISHDAGLGGELLVGLRWSDAFGPLLVIGPGGLDAERLAGAGFPPALLSPYFQDPGHLDRVLAENPFTGFLTRPDRGRPPRIAPEALRELAERFLAFAREAIPHTLLEIELNPVALVRRGDTVTPVALDAVARLGRWYGAVAADRETGAAGPAAGAGSAVSAVPRPRPLHKIDRLLHPRSVAVVGVSRRLNPGRRIVRNLLAAGFDRHRLFVVKEDCEELDGCPCVPSLDDLPEPVDLLVVAVAAQQVPEVMAVALAGRRAESIVLIPGGLGETEDSRRRAAALARQLDESRDTAWGGPVVNGGNCLGVRSVPGRVDTLFVPQHKLRFPATEPAPVAFFSQSGAFAIARASQLSRLNPAYLVTTGNQLDLSVADYLLHLAQQCEEGGADLRVFACYVEGFGPGDGRRFLEAVERVRAAGRTVVLYLAGRTAAGAAASASHTAAVAGDPHAARELARQAGALVADSLEDFDDLVRLAWRMEGRELPGKGRRPAAPVSAPAPAADRPADRGTAAAGEARTGGAGAAPAPLRVGAVSNAGFECVAIADNLGPLALADFASATREALADLLRRARVEGIVEVHNPLDLTPILADEPFAEAARRVLADENVDLGVIGCVPLTGALATLPPPGKEPARQPVEEGTARFATSPSGAGGPAAAGGTPPEDVAPEDVAPQDRAPQDRAAEDRSAGGTAPEGVAPEDRADLAAPESVGPRLLRLWRETRKPWVAVVDSGPLYDPLADLLEAGGVPVFRRADRALRILGQWAAWRAAAAD